MSALDTHPGEGRQAAALAEIREIVGPKGWLDDPEARAPHLTDWRKLYTGRAAAVVRPASTEEVAAVVRRCAEARIPIVPQGGNTGLVGGAAPHEAGTEIVLLTDRLSRIREVDPVGNTVTVEAGVVLQDIQQAAAEADRLFPLALGAQGSCHIGGNLATNAGGLNVLRYGNARDLVLGLEVVLPDGRVWDGLSGLRKDNTGYDLKHLFVGSEGTLGIVTAAVLKLFPQPRQVMTAMLAVADPAAAVSLLHKAQEASGGQLVAFELVPKFAIDLAVAHVEGVENPVGGDTGWYVLLEFATPSTESAFIDALEQFVEKTFEEELVVDGTIAANEAQRAGLWRLREAIIEAQDRAGAQLKHDVSVAVAKVPDFIAEATAVAEAEEPGVRVVAFGHVGDGNVHLNLVQPEGADGAAFMARSDALSQAVYDVVVAMGGSISAEHGIGRLKKADLAARKSPVALDLMRKIKRALDPDGLMNPGKLLE
jgi:FAD/FMN-containing dehydrogenase